MTNSIRINESSQDTDLIIMQSDTYNMEKYRKQWLCGEWKNLVKIKKSFLENHPERSKLALMIASAWQQQNNHKKTSYFLSLANEWGCDSKLVTAVLIANVHNTLGRMAALLKDDQSATVHFRNAVAVACADSELELSSHQRSVNEMLNLGLLAQTATVIDEETKKTNNGLSRPKDVQASIKVLQTEIELLHHELSLAQQRQQLFNDFQNKASLSSENEYLENLKKKSVSQLGQDIWVLQQTSFKRNGFFVEFGATDGVLLSNTYLLEKGFGWRGICSEPNPKFFKELKKNRNCIVATDCLSGETGKVVEFIFADAYGGSKEYANADSHYEKRAAYEVKNGSFKLKTISLHDFLIKHNAPKEIDYLSIDTEGSELEILSVFPFEKWSIRLFTIEHNFTSQREYIRLLMQKNGYVCFEQFWDDWYVCRSFV